jgi:hypothetical protein
MTMYQEVISYRQIYNESFSGLCAIMKRFVDKKRPLILDCQIHWSKTHGQWIATLYYKLIEEEE